MVLTIFEPYVYRTSLVNFDFKSFLNVIAVWFSFGSSYNNLHDNGCFEVCLVTPRTDEEYLVIPEHSEYLERITITLEGRYLTSHFTIFCHSPTSSSGQNYRKYVQQL